MNGKRGLTWSQIAALARVASQRGDADRAVYDAARRALALLDDPDAEASDATMVTTELRAAINWRDAVGAMERRAVIDAA